MAALHESDDFRTFIKDRAAAARAYVVGDATPLNDMLTTGTAATFFGPVGGFQQGAQEVASAFGEGARSFTPDGDSHLETLQMGSSGDVGFWVGLQHARVRLRDTENIVPMDLRVTEVFKRQAGAWKLVHRHADKQTT